MTAQLERHTHKNAGSSLLAIFLSESSAYTVSSNGDTKPDDGSHLDLRVIVTHNDGRNESHQARR